MVIAANIKGSTEPMNTPVKTGGLTIERENSNPAGARASTWAL